MKIKHDITIIGGGLAGCEAALQLAKFGLSVKLVEMRPSVSTGAHQTGDLAELVCSNSLGSNLQNRASGVLKNELRRMGSFLLRIADESSVPAGRALAVDRNLFSTRVTNIIESSDRIDLIRAEIKDFPKSPAIIATGPLTSNAFAASITEKLGKDNLFFYDAISPIVEIDTIDMDIAFRGSRYQKEYLEPGDYINIPFSQDQYHKFVGLLKTGKRNPPEVFEKDIDIGVKAGTAKYFEGCLPVETTAQRGDEALAFGPMKPVGFIDPHTQKRPYAIIQLRQDNIAGDLFNMVGFQTNLTFSEQLRIFRTIPGFANAKFIRFGQMHRNTYISSPTCLNPTLEFRAESGIFFAGQITGIEGYIGNIGTGLLAGWNAFQRIKGKTLFELPSTIMLGALCNYISRAELDVFQPMKANFGLFPRFHGAKKISKQERYTKYAERSKRDLNLLLKENIIP